MHNLKAISYFCSFGSLPEVKNANLGHCGPLGVKKLSVGDILHTFWDVKKDTLGEFLGVPKDTMFEI